ncbi:MAG: phosphoenolpyruvate--protein phosphotransferase [Plesiomonas sp.]|uniref:phosphoenolpyruvate--protein phosphotransferase n=1 Tax=Plesiomonas sp. TaxID=2486279 RepID=UPI003F379850
MLTKLREIVEQVAAATDLPQALELLVNKTCQIMKTEVCSVYLADHTHRCYRLMATRGLKPAGKLVSLAFDEGVVGLVGSRAEPINLADVRQHPRFKFLPDICEESYRSFLGTPIIYRRQLLGVLVVQQREVRQFDESEESFLVTLATQLASILSHTQSLGLLNGTQQRRIRAQAAASGVAIGIGWRDRTYLSLEDIAQASTLDLDTERERLSRAVESAASEFRRHSKRFNADISSESAAIFDLYIHLLSDIALRKAMAEQLDQGVVAEWAVRKTFEHFAEQFANLSDPYLRERANDMRTLAHRLLFHLMDVPESEWNLPAQFILVTDELTATLIAELPREKMVGIVVRDGAANSHAAILARALGVPTVMGVDVEPDLLEGRELIIDGYRGNVIVNPEHTLRTEYQRLILEEQELDDKVAVSLDKQAQTACGQHINILLNAGLSADCRIAVNQGVDGVGLYRTEVPFLLHGSFPSEDEQVALYQLILQRYPSKPVVMRTLDVGGDKPLPYLQIHEDNPFLGWRGIRLTLDHPDIFITQIRAMLRASIGFDNLSIMLPMISGIGEVDEARQLIDRAFREVAEQVQTQGLTLKMPKVGIMVEVPSMLYQLQFLPGKIDFISVGSNDLTQYLLAVDRNNARVADIFDSLHPAVLRALKQISTEGQQLNLPVSLCGELAGDPIGALLLVGMGYRHLSMNGRNVARIKYLLSAVTLDDLHILAERALSARVTTEVRHLTAAFMERRGFGGFIRGGNSFY